MVKIYPDDPKTIARMQSRIQVHTTGGSLSLASIKLDNGTELLSIGMESSEGNIVYTLDLDEFSSALEALKAGVALPKAKPAKKSRVKKATPYDPEDPHGDARAASDGRGEQDPE